MQVAAPMVFQCGACRHVVSDSNQLLLAVAELDVLVLDAVIGVVVGQGDPDSSCAVLRCAKCEHKLGHLYTKAPEPSLASLVSTQDAPRYALTRAALECYVLGSARDAHNLTGVSGTRADIESSHSVTDEGAIPEQRQLVDPTSRLHALESSEADVRTQLSQLMRVVLALDQRLRTLEGEDSGAGNEHERKRPR